MAIELVTERLCLRQWRDDDYPSFAELNADPSVMAFFPRRLTRKESDQLAKRCRQLIDQRGWGFWAVSLNSSDTFIGFVGLHTPKPNLPCSPCVEVGWRLHRKYWGKGYATEAANRSLKFAFEKLTLPRVVSFTAAINFRSRAVMERLNMSNTKRNFFHPDLAPDHPLAEHVLYQIDAAGFSL